MTTTIVIKHDNTEDLKQELLNLIKYSLTDISEETITVSGSLKMTHKDK